MIVQINKAPSDPACTRISIGGGENVGGYYCTYRGSVDSAINALRHALKAMEKVKLTGKEPKVDRRFHELGAS